MSSVSATHRHIYIGLQYLRAVAALLVVYSHTVFQIPQWKNDLDGVLTHDVGLAGVDIFFVVSGFVMWMTGRESTPAEFLLRRLVRIAPLYWIMTLAAAVAAVAIPYNLVSSIHHLTLPHLLESLVFVPFPNPDVDEAVMPLLVPGWTLNLEMTFYLLFALALLLPAQLRLYAVGAVLCALALVGMLLPAAPPVAAFYLTTRMVEFWCGMLIAQASLSGLTRRLPVPLSVTLLICGFVLLMTLVSQTVIHPLPCAIAAAMVVLATVSLEVTRGIRRLGWLESQGDASYSTYLSHLFMLGIVRTVWYKIYNGHPPSHAPDEAAFVLASLVFAVLGGMLTYRILERPLLKACRAGIRALAARPPALAPS